LAASAFLFWQSFRISGFQSWSSAGVFPMLAAGTMVLALLMAGLRQRRIVVTQAEGPRGLRALLTTIAPMPLVGGVTSIALYMMLLKPLGFLLASFLFLVTSMRLFGSRRWSLNAGISLLSLAVIHLVFSTLFSVVLPRGDWLIRFFNT
jgi:putative tricarboxylic transport membrane protein